MTHVKIVWSRGGGKEREKERERERKSESKRASSYLPGTVHSQTPRLAYDLSQQPRHYQDSGSGGSN